MALAPVFSPCLSWGILVWQTPRRNAGRVSAGASHAGRKAVQAKTGEGVELLTKAAVQDDRNSDLETCSATRIGTSAGSRSVQALLKIALRLNPRHREAMIHRRSVTDGEQPPKAAEHLAALKEICLIPARSRDLREGDRAYRTGHRK